MDTLATTGVKKIGKRTVGIKLDGMLTGIDSFFISAGRNEKKRFLTVCCGTPRIELVPHIILVFRITNSILT